MFKTKLKSKSPTRGVKWHNFTSKISIIGILGSALVIAAIVGAFFLDELFAFWKYDGNVPGILEGGIYILPLNLFLMRTNELAISSPDVYILLGIYLPFLVVGILGLIGSLMGRRGLITSAGFLGMCAVPLSIFIITRLLAMYGIISPGMEWTGLFAYNQALGTGTFTMALWIGFYLCAAGSYLIFFGRPRSK
ncbi:MAG: hypothetical protein RBG13Loki_2184 [Promethearchaeota archaeon CR_4]|nr:MAG: hypothetical protein RBG13Loki_2184 [Candidatus Lokiarchaeota archaeon CR_4]